MGASEDAVLAGQREAYMTPEALALVERARALAPKLAERAAQAERDGLVPAESVREMQEAGFFKVLQPKRYTSLSCENSPLQEALHDACCISCTVRNSRSSKRSV